MRKHHLVFGLLIGLIVTTSIVGYFMLRKEKDPYEEGIYFIHTIAQIVMTNEEDSNLELYYYNVKHYEESLINEVWLILDDGTKVPIGFEQPQIVDENDIYVTKKLVLHMLATNFETNRLYHFNKVEFVSNNQTIDYVIGDLYLYKMDKDREPDQINSFEMSVTDRYIQYTIKNEHDKGIFIDELMIFGKKPIEHELVNPGHKFTLSSPLDLPSDKPYRLVLKPLIRYRYDGQEKVTTLRTYVTSTGNYIDENVVRSYLRNVSQK